MVETRSRLLFRKRLQMKSGEEWRKLFTRASYLATDICAILVKSEECFWKWLTIYHAHRNAD